MIAFLLALVLAPASAPAVPKLSTFHSDDASLLGVVDSVHASVVTVVGYPPPDPEVRARGMRRRVISTGLVTAADRIITPASLAAPGGSVRVLLGAGIERPARLRGVDRQSNVALFEVEGASLRSLVPAPPQSLAIGAWVAVVSNVAITRPQAALGRIIGRGERLDFAHPRAEVLEIDAPTYPGSTGGAVLNEDGDWVAFVVGRAAPGPGDGARVGLEGMEPVPQPNSVLLALPVEQVTWIAKELDAYGSVRRGFLGIQLRRAPASPADSLGVLVASVVPGSPADSAGFRPGDRILAVEGEEAHTADELTAMVRSVRPGEEIELTVLRENEIFPIRAVLGAAFAEPPIGPRPSSARLRQMKQEVERLERERRRLEAEIRTLEGSSSR